MKDDRVKEPNWTPQTHEGEWYLFRSDGSWFIGFQGPGGHEPDRAGRATFIDVFSLVALTIPGQDPQGQISLREHFQVRPVLFLHAVPLSRWKTDVQIPVSDLLEIDRNDVMRMIRAVWDDMVTNRAGKSGIVLSGEMPKGRA